MKVYLDANVFIFATLDKSAKGDIFRGVLTKIAKGKYSAFVSALVLDEVMWVLLKNGHSDLIERVIRNIYALPNCEIIAVSSNVPLIALNYLKRGVKPRDAFHLATMQELGLKTIISDDAGFDNLGVKRLTSF